MYGHAGSWGSAQTPGWLRHKNVAGGSAPRPPLGRRPKPFRRGLGRSAQLHSCGEATPGFGAAPLAPSGYASDHTPTPVRSVLYGDKVKCPAYAF